MRETSATPLAEITFPALLLPMALLEERTRTPSNPLPSCEYRPFTEGPAMPIWLPRIWLPEAPGWTRMPCAPLPQMILFSCGLLPPTVVLDEFRITPCWALPTPLTYWTLSGAVRGDPVLRSTG